MKIFKNRNENSHFIIIFLQKSLCKKGMKFNAAGAQVK